MISRLHLENLGPMPKLEVDFAPRVNVITGDNGLGKTLMLDLAWYALTRTWPEDRKALPNFGAQKAAVIECAIRGANGKESTSASTFDRSRRIAPTSKIGSSISRLARTAPSSWRHYPGQNMAMSRAGSRLRQWISLRVIPKKRKKRLIFLRFRGQTDCAAKAH